MASSKSKKNKGKVDETPAQEAGNRERLARERFEKQQREVGVALLAIVIRQNVLQLTIRADEIGDPQAWERFNLKIKAIKEAAKASEHRYLWEPNQMEWFKPNLAGLEEREAKKAQAKWVAAIDAHRGELVQLESDYRDPVFGRLSSIRETERPFVQIDGYDVPLASILHLRRADFKIAITHKVVEAVQPELAAAV